LRLRYQHGVLGGVGVGARRQEDSGSEEESEGECKEGESERTKRERRESEGRRELEHARVCHCEVQSAVAPAGLIVFGFLSATADGRTRRKWPPP